MDCKHVNDNLVDFLYQELGADELDRIENHLKECQGCASELEAFESTRQLARQLPQLEPSSAVTDRLLKEAARAIQPEETVGFWDRVRIGLRMLVVHPAMTAAVALVLVLGVSFYAYRHTSPPKPEESLRGGDLPEVEQALRPAPTGEPAGAPSAPDPAAAAPAGTTVAKAAQDQEKQLVDNKDEALQARHRVALKPQTVPSADKPVEAAKEGLAESARAPRARVKRRARRPKARPRPRRTVAAKPKSPHYRKGPPAKEPAPQPAPAATEDSLDSFARGKADDDSTKKRTVAKRTLGVTGKGKNAKVPGAYYWLLKARKSTKTGRLVQALRYYHKALETEPQLRRELGPEVQSVARKVGRKDTGALKKIQQQLPLLAGWLEAEIATARRRARKKAKPKAKRKASQRKKAPAAPAQQNAAE
jgi:hypothetical protein